jgi:hypothetical protein
MERAVGMASSNPLGGSNFRESHLINIKSYPAIALLSPEPGYGSILIKVQSLQTIGWKIEENRLLYIRRDVQTFN